MACPRILTVRREASGWRAARWRSSGSRRCSTSVHHARPSACDIQGLLLDAYGAGRNDVNSIYFELRHFNAADLIRDAFKDDLEIIGGVLSEECSSLYVKRNEPVPPEKSARDIAH